jgi:hypothetical protein
VTKHNMTRDQCWPDQWPVAVSLGWSISISPSLYIKALGAYRWLVKIIRNKIIGM